MAITVQLPELNYGCLVKLLQSPVLQFLGVMFAVGAGKSKEKLAAEVAKQLPQIKWTMGVVGFLQSMLFFRKSLQYFKSISDNMWEVAVTSQTCATRANVMEWRSCLGFSAKWHNCSLQSAYMLWQKKQSTVPCCPANQSMQLETGQPMTQLDQFIATSEWPVTRLQILEIDNCLSIAHENYLLMTVAKKQFADAKQADIWKWEKVYKQWCQIASSTNGFDLKQFPERVMEAVENQHLSMQWDAPAFNFH
jgi:hypothetical protein